MNIECQEKCIIGSDNAQLHLITYNRIHALQILTYIYVVSLQLWLSPELSLGVADEGQT